MTVKQRLDLVRLGVDLEAVLDVFCNNEEAYIVCLHKFAADKSYNCMLDAIRNNDVDKAFEAAHSLKGVSGNLGFTELFDEVAIITEVFRNKSMDYDINNLENIRNNYKKVIDIIENI